jgi:DNA primase
MEIAEGAALAAVADAVERAVLPIGNLGLLLEYFRDSPHGDIIAALASQVEMDGGDEGEQEEVFADAIERLQGQALRRRIDALNARARAGILSTEERQTLASLLARKRA